MDAADRMFGELAVELGHLSRDGLAACIRTQYDSAAGTTLSSIALNLGLMQQAEIDLVLLQQARVGDRRKPKARAGVVEIDATLGGSSEDRGNARSASSDRHHSARAQSRDASTQTNQPPVAAAYRTASAPKMQAVVAREPGATQPRTTAKADNMTAAAQATVTAPRRPDRTLLGTGLPSTKKSESTPSHEAITIAPPPPAELAAEYETAYDASDDPEVSFESESPTAPTPTTAIPARAAQPPADAPAGVGFRRRTTPPQPDLPTSDDTEISFGSLLSIPPAAAGEAKRAPLSGTLHGVGAPTPTSEPQPAVNVKPQPSFAAKPQKTTELPSVPAMVSPPQAQPTPPGAVGSIRPRSPTLEFKPSVTPAEPQAATTGGKPARKPSATIQHFRAVIPAAEPADINARTTVGPRPGSVGWAVDDAQPLVTPSTTTRRPSGRPPRRASAWFSSRPALVADGEAHGAVLSARVETAASDIQDAALAQLPAGNEPLMFRALRAVLNRGAHDLHLHRDAPIMMRLHGGLQPLFGGTPMGERGAEQTLAQIMTDAQWKTLSEVGELTFSIELPETGRARVSAYRSDHGCSAVVRVMPSEPRDLTALGLPTSLAKLLDYESGLIVCTGPIGSGVTTTMGALLAGVVTSRQAHVVTIEETIELRVPVTRSLVSQRQLGVHVDNMARAVRAIAHEDADLVAIGDLRHPGDVALALSLAHGGHLVLAGAHARGAADCLNRLLRPFGKHDQGQARTMVAQSLRAVISQELVMRADGKGRVPAIELMIATPAVCDMIRRGAALDVASLSTSGKAQKLVTLADSLQRLVAAGTVTAAEADRVAQNRMRQA